MKEKLVKLFKPGQKKTYWTFLFSLLFFRGKDLLLTIWFAKQKGMNRLWISLNFRIFIKTSQNLKSSKWKSSFSEHSCIAGCDSLPHLFSCQVLNFENDIMYWIVWKEAKNTSCVTVILFCMFNQLVLKGNVYLWY